MQKLEKWQKQQIARKCVDRTQHPIVQSDNGDIEGILSKFKIHVCEKPTRRTHTHYLI